jgi:hypothetical protein
MKTVLLRPWPGSAVVKSVDVVRASELVVADVGGSRSGLPQRDRPVLTRLAIPCLRSDRQSEGIPVSERPELSESARLKCAARVSQAAC